MTENKKCPRCAETIKREAKVCKHCGHEIPKKDTCNIFQNDILDVSNLSFEDQNLVNVIQNNLSEIGYNVTGSEKKWAINHSNGIGKTYAWDLDELKRYSQSIISQKNNDKKNIEISN